MAFITAANAIYTISILPIFPSVQLQGFSTDDAFDTGSIQISEVMMGVDGKLSGGYTPQPYEQTIALQADSASIAVFDAWATTIITAQEEFTANAVIILPSTGKKYICTKGFLRNYKPLPDVKKVLQPVSYGIVWESIIPALV